MVTLVVFGYELLQSNQNKAQQQEMLVVSDLNFDVSTLARVYTHTELSEFAQHLAEAALLMKQGGDEEQEQKQEQEQITGASLTNTGTGASGGAYRKEPPVEVGVLPPGDGAVVLATKVQG